MLSGAASDREVLDLSHEPRRLCPSAFSARGHRTARHSDRSSLSLSPIRDLVLPATSNLREDIGVRAGADI